MKKLLKRLFRRKRFDHPRKVRRFVWEMFLKNTQPYDARNRYHYYLVRHTIESHTVSREDWKGLKLSGIILNEHIVN